MKTKILLAFEPILIALGFLIPVSVFSHANLTQNSTLKPRDNANPLANKTPAGVATSYNPGTMAADPGPTCGQNPNTGVLVSRSATQPVTNLAAGASLTVNWLHTINHTGWFQIWWTPNANDTGWILLRDQIPKDGAGAFPRAYSATITVPTQNCSACAIRVIEVMTDNNPPTYYYSCANITITPDGQPPAGSTGGSGSTSGTGGSNCP